MALELLENIGSDRYVPPRLQIIKVHESALRECVHRRHFSLECWGGDFSYWGRPLFKNTGGMTNGSNAYI